LSGVDGVAITVKDELLVAVFPETVTAIGPVVATTGTVVTICVFVD
jgi:hypothetical protein